MRPLAVNDPRIDLSIQSYMENVELFIPTLRHDSTYNEILYLIENIIKYSDCKRLYGLLCHYVYWNIIHPFARRTLLLLREKLNDDDTKKIITDSNIILEEMDDIESMSSRMKYIYEMKDFNDNNKYQSDNDDNSSTSMHHNNNSSVMTLSSITSINCEERDLLYLQVEKSFSRLQKKVIIITSFSILVCIIKSMLIFMC
jgi:hypothetical protein